MMEGVKVWCALVLLMVPVSINAAPTDTDGLTLRIIHTNDMHSRFEETSQLSGICNEHDSKAGKCYGGFARLATLIRAARASATMDKPVFFLNAGDTYLGSKLFTHYKYNIVIKLLGMLAPDVVSLGNHEFDQGVQGLVPYLNQVEFPVVAANLDVTFEPELQKTRQLKKSVILMAKNKKIGVIGYLTPETKQLSQTEQVKFIDEVKGISDEAKRLKSEGCDIIIALGHSGYEVDKHIGREVEDVDLVIGGHTNTFLYTGPEPDVEKAEGPYPTVVVQPSGRKVYVVQAYAYTKYLGDLTIDFDGRGEITHIQGKPILVDSSVAMAYDVAEELKKWTGPLANSSTEIIGRTKVLLQGSEFICRLHECNFGNLLTDAMIYHNAKLYTGEMGWTDAAIAVHQSGGIRSSISDNEISKDDILTAFPFGTGIFKINVTAKTMMEMLEWSVHDRLTQNTTSHGGGFLQLSGVQVTYNLSRPVDSRVVMVKVRCSFCAVPTYEPLDMDAIYTMLLPDFMFRGGDGFSMFKQLPYKNINSTVERVVREYINTTSPVYPGVEGRIQFVIDESGAQDSSREEKSSPNSAISSTCTSMLVLLGSLSLMRLL